MSSMIRSRERREDRAPFSQERSLDLVVSWQHPRTRATTPVGLLSRLSDGYLFRYLQRAGDVEGFRPLLGFPDLATTYRSEYLFPLFAQRAMADPQRGDYGAYLAQLGLLTGASPWEQIVRSSGDSAADTIKVSPMPVLLDGSWYTVSAVTGTKYLTEKSVVVQQQTRGPYSWAEIDALLTTYRVGDQVRLVHESQNDYSAAATLVVSEDGQPFGYLPDWLAHMVLPFLEQEASAALIDQVVHDGARWYVRVLLRLDGRVGVSLESLLGEGWETYSDR